MPEAVEESVAEPDLGDEELAAVIAAAVAASEGTFYGWFCGSFN